MILDIENRTSHNAHSLRQSFRVAVVSRMIVYHLDYLVAINREVNDRIESHTSKAERRVVESINSLDTAVTEQIRSEAISIKSSF